MNLESQKSRQPFNIVVGLKFSDGGAFAVDQAARIAEYMPAAALQLIHIFETPLSKDAAEKMIEHLQLYADEKIASLGGGNGRAVGVHVRSGDVARALAQMATDTGAHLIVLGTEARELPSWRTTRTVERVMALAPCPVLVAGPKPAPLNASEPTIEPPCPDCVTARRESSGRQWWCARHSARALLAHSYSYQRELPFATPDTLIGPGG
jgi:nucleotide-binding universal stress UspA family protein